MVERNFKVNLKEKKAAEVNFTTIFQEGLPPQAKELIYDIEELLKKEGQESIKDPNYA